jgi:hypothetical protein
MVDANESIKNKNNKMKMKEKIEIPLNEIPKRVH